MTKISVDNPQFDKGVPIGILGNLAVVENGGSVDVDDETLAMYTEQTGKDAETAMASSPVIAFGDKETVKQKRDRLEKEATKAAEAEESKNAAETEQGSSGDETNSK